MCYCGRSEEYHVMYKSVDKLSSKSVHNFCQYKLPVFNKFQTAIYIFAPSPFHGYKVSVDVLLYLDHICARVFCVSDMLFLHAVLVM